MIHRRELISATYLDSQKYLHAQPRGYGGKGDKWAPVVRDLVCELDATSVLDYGCGRGTLKRALAAYEIPALRIDEYDPAIPGKDGPPLFADLVVCTDVLEHVEPDRLDKVLAHLKLLARKAVFVVVATRPASKTLPDGRNAHLIIENDTWWTARLQAAGFWVQPGPTRPGSKPAREFTAVMRHD